MSLEKITYGVTNSCKGVMKSTGTKAQQLIQDPCAKGDLTSALDALALNAKAALAKNTSLWKEAHLKSVPSSKRLEALVHQDDKLVPDSYKLTEWLTSYEQSAISMWQKGWLICNNNMQQEFDNYALKQGEVFWQNIKIIDDLIKSATPLQEDCIVYRGLLGQDFSQIKFIESLKEGMIIPHQTYLATATKINGYTKGFLNHKDTMACMRIKLPKGTKGILLNDKLDEFVLPRGANIKINKIDNKTGIIDAEYILPEKTIDIPKFAQKILEKADSKKTPRQLEIIKEAKIRNKLCQYFEENQPDKFDEIYDKISECGNLKTLERQFGDTIAQLKIE